ncbi:hypothetical protein VTI74DRAFT_1750 [Chaetomium olivicolor]
MSTVCLPTRGATALPVISSPITTPTCVLFVLNAFALADVQKHIKPDELRLLIHNKVHDATGYLEDGPGDVAALHEVAGIDATETFEEVGHPIKGNDVLATFYLGDLVKEGHSKELKTSALRITI